jgi:diguanylate cyclase (GGDEF)-like protein/PAS domain S-box-containing protein
LRRARGTSRSAPLPSEELDSPVLKQYSETLIRKLEEKSEQLSQAFEGLAHTEARLSGLVESALDAIIAVDEHQRVVLFNGAAERMFGISRTQALQQSLDLFIPERFRGAHGGQLKAFAGGARSSRSMGARMVWALRADGSEFPVEASISRQETSRGMLFTVFLRDISERYEFEQALAGSELRLRRVNRVLSVLSGINNLIVRATECDALLYGACRIAVEAGQFSKAWIGLVGRADGRLRLEASHGCDADFLREADAFLSQQESAQHVGWASALRSLQPVVVNELSDEPLALQTALATGSRSLAALPLEQDGQLAGVMVLHAAEPSFFDDEGMALLRELAGDISFALANLQRRAQIHFMANFDPLTGLPNRSQFSDQLSHELTSAARHGGMLAVVLLDLERFRRVNETHGRAVGDELLQQVSKRLQEVSATASRFGGDHFALRLNEARSAADVARALEDIATRCFGEPFHLHDEEIRVGVRMGIAVHPGDGDDAESLLRNAEAAVRRARQSVEQLVFYAPEHNARAAEALGLESRLRRAIERREFVLFYQPKVDMSSRRIVGLEALIRWRDPERGLVPPGLFIPVLEECGLIGPVGEWALDDALSQQRAWVAEGLTAPRVAVNVSPLQLRPTGFADSICALLDRHPGAALELEVTESVIMDNVERNIAAITQLRSAGVSVAIDDFGTGYCSLAYIAKLPVTSLKVDRAFVLGMTEGPEGLAIVSSIIALAHSLGLGVVAEGVETEDQARLLRLLACDQAQGYLFCRPQPAAVIADLLRGAAPLP